eukprot:NODE_70_length_23697_cov_0.294771.p8 type:complete len:320 gc:universal NODE_70_length_23697_cov_0.294771:22046-23005(+)
MNKLDKALMRSMKNVTQVRLGKLASSGLLVDFCIYIAQDDNEEYYKLNDIEVLLGVRDVKNTINTENLLEYDNSYLVQRNALKMLTETMDLKSKQILTYDLEDFNNGKARQFLCALPNFTPVDPIIVKSFAIGGHKRSSPSSDEENIMRKKMRIGNELTIDVKQSTESLPSLSNMLDSSGMRRQSVSEDAPNRRKSAVQDELRNISQLKQQMYMKRTMAPFGLNTAMNPDLLTPSKSSPAISINGMSQQGSTPTSGSPKPTVKQMFLPMFDKLCEYMDAQTSRIDVSLAASRNCEKGLFDIRKQFKDFADNMNGKLLLI